MYINQHHPLERPAAAALLRATLVMILLEHDIDDGLHVMLTVWF
jgi:hypothetical protein